MIDNIKDKVIVIAGASSGLGAAAARRLARDGCLGFVRRGANRRNPTR